MTYKDKIIQYATKLPDTKDSRICCRFKMQKANVLKLLCATLTVMGVL